MTQCMQGFNPLVTAEPSFQLIAHRGLSSRRPENTYAAFDLALAKGFSNFETDCQLSRDGVAFVVHDEELKRVCRGAAAPVAALTAAQLDTLDVGSWFGTQRAGERIPRLWDVLQRYYGRAHIHLELKSAQPELPAKVAEALQGTGWCSNSAGGGPADDIFAVPGITLTSFHLEQLKRSRQLLPEVRHAWLVHDLSEDVLKTAKLAGIAQVCPRANICDAEAIAKALQAGLSVRGWGVKDLQLLFRLKECGAQGCTVDWPDEAREALLQGSS